MFEDDDDMDDQCQQADCNECGLPTQGCSVVETPEGVWHTSCAADSGEIDYDY